MPIHLDEEGLSAEGKLGLIAFSGKS